MVNWVWFDRLDRGGCVEAEEGLAGSVWDSMTAVRVAALSITAVSSSAVSV
jgi:hypothetical protein